MPRTSDLTGRISELLALGKEISEEELEEIVRYESDERIAPVDTLNIGIVFSCQERYVDALHCFSNALEAYETPDEKNLRTYTFAHIGQAVMHVGNHLFREGDWDAAVEMFAQSAKVYSHVLDDLRDIPVQIIPVILVNAATVY